MHCLFYASDSGPDSRRLEGKLVQALPRLRVERMREPEELAARLRRETWSVLLVVLLVESEEELRRVKDLRGLLQGVKVLVALPRRLARLSSAVVGLRPRFVDSGSQGWRELCSVAARIGGADARAAGDGGETLSEESGASVASGAWEAFG